jgi:hypothetical protein
MATGAPSWRGKVTRKCNGAPTPSSAIVKNGQSYTSTPSLCLHGTSLETFTCFTFTSTGSCKQNDKNILYKTFMTLEAVTMEDTVFWDAMSCHLAHSYRCFQGTSQTEGQKLWQHVSQWETNSMRQSSSWEANTFSVNCKILCIIWDLKVYYCVHKSLILIPILSQMSPEQAMTSNPVCL